MGEIGGASPTARDALKKAVDRYRDLMAQGLARAQEEGVVRKDRAARDMADLIFDGWQGALLRMKIECSAAPLYAFIQAGLVGACAASQ
jgi:TetR/AcrR family transcriptional repressor of nem operon